MILLFLACNSGQVQRMETQTQRLEARAHALRKEFDALQEAWDAANAYWEPRVPVHMPPGYDPTGPLPAGGSRPDVLLVSIDTLRADHLGCYGYERPTSPFLDGLAATGTRYERFWSPAPWTLPSHTTMLSGWLPDRHGTYEDTTSIPASVPLVQETFQRAGYRTAGVVSTLFVSQRFGFERGFDHFQDFGITDPAANNRGTVDAVEVFADVDHWAQQQPAGEPMFLFVHSYDVHYSYNAPQPFDSQFDRPAVFDDAHYRNYAYYFRHPLPAEQMTHQIAQYDEEIRYVDSELQRFVERWRASGRELIVAVTSDHGEEFGERGSWGHAHTLYPEQLHVPLVINGPGIRAQVLRERAGTEDIAGTLAALVGLEHPSGDGVDRHLQLRDGSSAGTSGTYAETSRFETTRLRQHHNGFDLVVDLVAGTEELYDLDADPAATENLITSQTRRAAEVRGVLSKRLGTPWVPSERGSPEPQGQARIWQRGLHEGPLDGPFQVFPTDGSFVWHGAAEQGPWSARFGPLPSPDDAVTYRGPTWQQEGEAIGVELTKEETRMLEELGYLQD